MVFSLIKQVLIILWSFSSSLVRIVDQTKCLSLNDEICMVSPSYKTISYDNAKNEWIC